MDAAMFQIAQHVHETRSLLRMRAVCRQARDCITIESIIGMEMRQALGVWNGKSWYSSTEPMIEYITAIGTAMTDGGLRFWTWTYNDPMQLTRFECTNATSPPRFKSMYTVKCEWGCLLWMQAIDNNHICTLSVLDEDSDDSPVVLIVLKIKGGQFEIVKQIEMEREQVMRKCIFGDEDIRDLFVHRRVFCANNTVFIMGENALGVVVRLADKGSEESMTWFQDMRMHIACKVGCLVYMTSAELGKVYRIDTTDKKQNPELVTTISPLQMMRHDDAVFWQKKNTVRDVAEFRVSCSERSYVMYYKDKKELVHYNSSCKLWATLECKIDVLDFAFIGEDALVCIIQNICEFRIYNIATQCLVRKFPTPHVARVSVLSSDVYWTVGYSMSTHQRQHGRLGLDAVDDTVACNNSLAISKV